MSSCCGSQTPRCCECPPGLRLEKTPQAPVFDMLGPHPDEVIMTILDRILYLSGATKIIPMLELAGYGSSLKKESCPPTSTCTSASTSVPPSSSMWNTCCSKPPSTTNTCCSKPTSSCGSRKVTPVTCIPKVPTPCTPKSCCKTSSRLSAAACCPRQRTPRVDFDHPADIIPLRKKAGGSATIKERMDSPISTCSVACHQLKTKLASQEFSGGSGKDQRWLWTRLIRGNDGCMVYEVYKESDADKSPSKIGSEAPIILFLVMPNGYIMPFESICSP
ncbi:uncharacterized protein [Drosophila takahashii]|uniref:uncharacterized protein n=1 Tax=Drosophila takahashii TaxID=29030 RepID=UPI001CF88DDC|nr:uncharacterized protein LOC108063327 [Drosophila takahashii]